MLSHSIYFEKIKKSPSIEINATMHDRVERIFVEYITSILPLDQIRTPLI